MNELYELRERLCDELKSYSRKDVSSGSLDVVDKLAHTIKNIDKIMENHEGYSNRGRYSRYSNDGHSYREDDYYDKRR